MSVQKLADSPTVEMGEAASSPVARYYQMRGFSPPASCLARSVGLSETENQAEHGRGAADGQAPYFGSRVTSVAAKEREAKD